MPWQLGPAADLTYDDYLLANKIIVLIKRLFAPSSSTALAHSPSPAQEKARTPHPVAPGLWDVFSVDQLLAETLTALSFLPVSSISHSARLALGLLALMSLVHRDDTALPIFLCCSFF